LCESILDLESLKQNYQVEGYELLANYGTEGGSEQIQAILNLTDLEEVVLFFDGDDAGRKGAQKIARILMERRHSLFVKIVATPDDEDVNSLLKNGEREQIGS